MRLKRELYIKNVLERYFLSIKKRERATRNRNPQELYLAEIKQTRTYHVLDRVHEAESHLGHFFCLANCLAKHCNRHISLFYFYFRGG